MRIGGSPMGESGRDADAGFVAASNDVRRDGGDCCRHEHQRQYNQAGKVLTACIEDVADSFPPNLESTETFASRSDSLFRSIIGPL
jgi:hypothetical protein